ncbi:MAG: pentapeptide repeat-containing protein [Deltaproteobacteria bacterium]|jgi:uncharacterized protein YjbI with pentapeptide repeats|nr:pentapeptide repeat-containing protein [Deltaproteobacteria bacterium]
MKTYAPKSLFVNSLSHRFAGRDYLALTLGLGFSLMDGSLLVPNLAYGAAIKALAPFAAQGLSFDLGIAKKRGEFLCLGQAQTDQPQTSPLRVAIEVGPLRREFLVTPEELVDGRIRPFKSQLLTWQVTEFDKIRNPVGVQPKVSRSAEGILASARVFDYQADPSGRLGKARSGPASPLPMAPLANLEKLGSFDQAWLESSWPGLPADFDFGFFNLAQEAQRLRSGYFRGDEPVALLNLHRRRLIKSALPGLRTRVIVKTGSLLFEAASLLDTVWLFPSQELAIILWKAAIPVVDEKASDLDVLALALEPLSEQPELADLLLARAEAGQWLEPPLADPSQPPPAVATPAQSLASVAPPKELAAAPVPGSLKAPKIPPLTITLPAIPAALAGWPAAISAAEAYLDEALPAINERLSSLGLAPLKKETITPFLREEAKSMDTGFKALQKAEAETRPPRAVAIEAMVSGGLSPPAAEGVAQALELAPPNKMAFENVADFEAAAKDYGQKWGALLGLPPRAGQEMGQKIIGLASQDPTQVVAALVGPEKAPEIAQALASSSPAELSPVDWSQLGLEPDTDQKLKMALEHLEQTTEATKNWSFADKMVGLKDVGQEFESTLGLPAGTMATSLDQQSQIFKQLLWGSEDVAQTLRAQALTSPDLAERLPQLTKLLKAPPLSANSLTDLGLMAGLTDPASLGLLASLDPLNQQSQMPKIEAILAPAGEKASQANQAAAAAAAANLKPSPAEPTPGLAAAASNVFPTRALVEERLVDPKASFAGARMVGLDLGGLDFSGRDLSAADLRESDLTGANLSRATLKNGFLTGARLSGANLTETNFSGADLTGVNFGLATALGADFSQANLAQADLGETCLGQFLAPKAYLAQTKLPSNLAGANLAEASFRSLDWTGYDLTGAKLDGADLRGVNLTSADLRGASLAKTSFGDCDLKRVKGQNIQAPGLRVMSCRTLEGADFSGADLTDLLLNQTPAAGAVFRSVSANRANFGAASLTGSDWSGASLKEAVLFRCDLRQAKVKGANLFKASLGGADLRGTDLGGSSLYAADLHRAQLDNLTNLAGADLTETVLTKSKI